MRIIRLSYGVKGFVNLARYSVRWLSMITEKAKYKIKILSFWEQYGIDATLDAFPVKRSTLFLWKQKLKKGGGKLEALNDLTKAPKMKRKRLWSFQIMEEIRKIRIEHPNLGKEKIHFLKYLLKEIMLGLFLGGIFGVCFGTFALIWFKSSAIAITVGTAVFASMAIAPAVSLIMPTILQKEHKDPALGSGPFTTILQDLISLSIYFLIASLIIFKI